MQQHLFVDDKGRTRSAEDERVRRRLGGNASRAELESFAVRVLGFVGLHCQLRRVRVVLRPLLVTGETVAGTCMLLAQHGPARIALSAADESGGWEHTIYGTPLAAMRAIEEMVGSAPKDAASYLTLRRPIDVLTRQPSGDPLAAVLQLWRSKLGRYDEETQWELDRLTAPTHSSVFECTRGSHRLLIRRWGAGTFYSPEWNRQAAGREIEDQPDSTYGRRVAANMRRCAMSGEPTLQEVDAVIDDPVSYATRLAYRRLVLRWEEAHNVELVTTTSLVSSARPMASRAAG